MAIQWRYQNVAGPPYQDPLCGRVKARSGLPKAIAKLPDGEQQVLMLYYEQDLSMREVGELMGVGDSRGVADPYARCEASVGRNVGNSCQLSVVGSP